MKRNIGKEEDKSPKKSRKGRGSQTTPFEQDAAEAGPSRGRPGKRKSKSRDRSSTSSSTNNLRLEDPEAVKLYDDTINGQIQPPETRYNGLVLLNILKVMTKRDMHPQLDLHSVKIAKLLC